MNICIHTICLIPLLFVVFLVSSCKTQKSNVIDTKSSSSVEYSKKPNNKLEDCLSIVNQTKNDFLSTKIPGISWDDESKTLPCWLSEIKNGNYEIEYIIIKRLRDRLDNIKNGQLLFLSTLRINDDIFSGLSTKEMLDIAFEYASWDTCIYYSEGATHFGYIGLRNLLKMVDRSYHDKFHGLYLKLLIEDEVLDKFNENSCEYWNYLYDKLYSMVKYDYENGLIGLRNARNEDIRN